MTTAELVTLAFSGIVAVSTVIYALLTWKLVVETRLLRTSQATPHIAAYLVPSEMHINILDLVIQNHGQGPAYSVRWNAGVDLGELAKKGVHLDHLKNLDGLSYMAPGQRIQSFFGSAVELLRHAPPPRVELCVEFSDVFGKKHEASYVLDPARYEGLSRVGDHPQHESAEALTTIAKVAKEVVAHSRVRTLITTEAELRQELEDYRKQADKFRASRQGSAADDRPQAGDRS